MPKRFKFVIAVNIVVLILWILLVIIPSVKAEPPHPRKHYKWIALPTNQVVLFFLENGQYSRYVYDSKMKPATPCAPKYGKTTFRLVTWDTTHPYFYTMPYKPVMKWSPKKKIYIPYEYKNK